MKLKRWMCLLAVLFMFAAVPAQADTVSSALHSNAETAEEQAQFPFLAETNELAVNVRKETSTKSAKVGRLERGTQLTVLGAQLSSSGEVWYAVALKEELLSTTTMTLFTTVIKVICSALAGILTVRRCRRRLWLYGAAGGGLYTLLAFGVFSAVAGSLCVSLALLSDIGMGLLSGLLSVMVMQMLK